MHEALICAAIRERRLLSFSYEYHRRLVEPHLLGYYVGGDLTLVAWQLAGGDRLQGWRDYALHGITELALADGTSRAPRRGYNPKDETIEEIVCCI